MKKVVGLLLGIALLAVCFVNRTLLMNPWRDATNKSWRGFHSGQTYVYDLRMESLSSFDMGRMVLPTDPNVRSHVPRSNFAVTIESGKLFVEVLTKNASGMELSFRLDVAAVHVDSPLVNLQGMESLKSELHTPFLADLAESGEIRSFYFGKAQTILTQNLLRQIVQHFIPADAEGERWEDSAQGQSFVLYEQDARGTVKKIFQDHRMKGSLVQPTISGSFQYDFDVQSGTIESVAGERTIRAVKDGNLHFDDTLKLTLTFSKAVPSQRNWVSSWQMRIQGQKSYADAREQLEMLEAEMNRKLVAGQAFSDLVGELKADASRVSAADQVDMYRKLKAHLALNPDLIDDFKDLIQEFGSSDPRADMLVTLLATHGSDAAQEALVDLMGDSLEDLQGLRNIGLHLSLVDRPSEETLEFFAEQLQDLDVQSPAFELMVQLAGSVIYSDNQPDLGKSIYNILEAQFENPGSSALYSAAVIGLGNSGHSQNWDKASALLQAGGADQRNQGLALLRLVQGQYAAEVETVFLNALSTDAEQANRRDAAAYLGQRKVSSAALPVLSQAFLNEKDPSVSMNILDAIARRPEDPKMAADALKELNQQCGAPETCSKAEALLLSLLSS
jgi:hypothetical protein